MCSSADTGVLKVNDMLFIDQLQPPMDMASMDMEKETVGKTVLFC